MTKQELLQAAMDAVADRGLNYGTPEDNFRRIAVMWNAYLTGRREPEAPIQPVDVALMMQLMKIARLQNQPAHLDSWIDIAGYAACGANIVSGGAPE